MNGMSILCSWSFLRAVSERSPSAQPVKLPAMQLLPKKGHGIVDLRGHSIGFSGYITTVVRTMSLSFPGTNLYLLMPCISEPRRRSGKTCANVRPSAQPHVSGEGSSSSKVAAADESPYRCLAHQPFFCRLRAPCPSTLQMLLLRQARRALPRPS